MNRRKHPIMPGTLQSTYNMELDSSFAAKKRLLHAVAYGCLLLLCSCYG